MTCKECIHYDVCGGYTPSDLDRDVFDYCREGRSDEIPDIEERCSGFKDASLYIELPCGKGAKLMYKDTEYTVDHWNILATAFAELPPEDTRSKLHLFDVKEARNAIKEQK